MAISLHELNSLPTRADLQELRQELKERDRQIMEHFQKLLELCRMLHGSENVKVPVPAENGIPLKEWLTLKDLTQIFGVNKSTVWNWQNLPFNALVPYQPGGYKSRLLYKRDDVIKFMDLNPEKGKR